MTPDALATATMPEEADQAQAPAAAGRFGRRWRLVAAGLSNVWRFGDLLLDAGSGRLLMRGANGTGKTTALEGMWPYLLDLNPRLLGAGKARQTTWTSLMREGANGARRRIGYVWLTFAAPGEGGELSYGVRVQFSEGASPPVTTIPFRVPGRPVTDMPLTGDGRTALSVDEFTDIITAVGGQVFTGDAADSEYVADLAARLLRTTVSEARLLAGRIRQVRNPNLLGDLSPQQAREALREALPGVADDVITATADALAETAATRAAFDRDRENARTITDFAAVWAGHAAEVVGGAFRAAQEAQAELRALDRRPAVSKVTPPAPLPHTNKPGRRLRIWIRLGYRSRAASRAWNRKTSTEPPGLLPRWSGSCAPSARPLTRHGKRSRLRRGRRAKPAASSRASLSELREDITAHQQLAGEADPDVAGLGPLVTWTRAPRAVLTVRTKAPTLAPWSRSSATRIRSLKRWQPGEPRRTRTRAGRRPPRLPWPIMRRSPPRTQLPMMPSKEAAALNKQLDNEERQLRDLTSATTEAAATLIADLLQWTRSQPLAGTPACTLAGPWLGHREDGWDTTDVEALRAAEPGQLLHAAEGFARRHNQGKH